MLIKQQLCAMLLATLMAAPVWAAENAAAGESADAPMTQQGGSMMAPGGDMMTHGGMMPMMQQGSGMMMHGGMMPMMNPQMMSMMHGMSQGYGQGKGGCDYHGMHPMGGMGHMMMQPQMMGGGMGNMMMNPQMMQMRMQHMQNMEQRLQNIEALLQQLVDQRQSE